MAVKFKVLSDNEVHGILLNALYCAARCYEESAKQCRDNLPTEPDKPAQERLAVQFDSQAKDARNLAELIESAETVNLANVTA